MNILIKTILPLAIVVAAIPAHAARNSASTAEAKQTTEDTSPQAQYQRSKREAQAAYQEALTSCKKMRGTERNSCMKEAKSNLQGDLAEAKKARSSGQ